MPGTYRRATFLLGDLDYKAIDFAGAKAIAETWRQLVLLPAANRWAGVKKTPGTDLLAESQRKVASPVCGF